MAKPRKREFDENEIATIWRDAFAKGWQACLEAVNATMQEKSAPYVSRGPAPEERSTQWFTLRAVTEQHGMSTLEAIEHAKALGCASPDNSIRVALMRLKGKHLIIARNNKWFPA